MKKSYKRGFTLIELLVVIAIIGILASIILASLATARSKGNDSKIQEQLKSIQSAAEIYYDTAGNYGTAACASMKADTTSGEASLFTPSNWPDGNAPTCQNTGASATAYLAYHALSSNTSNYWCVDSTGDSTLETSAIGAAATKCP